MDKLDIRFVCYGGGIMVGLIFGMAIMASLLI